MGIYHQWRRLPSGPRPRYRFTRLSDIDCSGDIGEQARPKHLRFPCNLDFLKREIVGAVSKSEKPIRKGILCKILSCAISSRPSFLTARVPPNDETRRPEYGGYPVGDVLDSFLVHDSASLTMICAEIRHTSSFTVATNVCISV